MRLNIATWNIHKGIGGIDRRYRLQRIVDVLAPLHADIALLQEVAEAMPRAGNDTQLHLLSQALAMPHIAYSPQHRFSVGGYGNAVLSRWPLSNVVELDLTIGTRKKRGALQTRARVRWGRRTRSIVITNLHLGLAGTERGAQLDRFLASQPYRGLHARTPVILGGDLNDLWGTLGPKYLLPHGFARAGPLAPTFPAWLPVRPLDGLFMRGDLDVVDAGPLKSELTRRASDHLPLLATVKLQKK